MSNIIRHNKLTRDISPDEFNKLNIHEKVKFINENIPHFKSGVNVCKEIGVSIDSFRNQIKNIYTYIPLYQSYVKISDLEASLKHITERQTNDMVVVDATEPAQSIYDISSLSNIENPHEKLISLLNNHDKILNLLENALEPSLSMSGNLNVSMNLNMPGSKLKKTTIRVNEDIWDSFKSCIQNDYGHLEQFDLISVALRDFVDKYSLNNN